MEGKRNRYSGVAVTVVRHILQIVSFFYYAIVNQKIDSIIFYASVTQSTEP